MIRRLFSSSSSISSSSLKDFSSKVVFLFPGQGSQFIGMNKDIINNNIKVKELFQQANEIIGYNLTEICLNGPLEKLNSTEVTQVAIFVSSMAAVEKLKLTDPNIVESCTVALGLSLGEYSALCFAGAISFEDGVRLTQARGQAMQFASDKKPSGMISIVGVSKDIIEDLCKQTKQELQQDVTIGNYLCDKNYSISGSIEAINYVSKLAHHHNPTKIVTLAVSGAFHSSYMLPAVPIFEQVLNKVNISPLRIPVISNTQASPYPLDGTTIKTELLKQITQPVQWEKSMNLILEHQREFGISYEIGPGRVCNGILKSISRRAKVVNIGV